MLLRKTVTNCLLNAHPFILTNFVSLNSFQRSQTLPGGFSFRRVRLSSTICALASLEEQTAHTSEEDRASLQSPAPLSSETSSGLLELGTFGSPHGVKGDIKFYALTDSPLERLNTPGSKFVQPQRASVLQRNSQARPVEVERCRPILNKGKEVWLVKLKGIDTPEAAEAFKAQCLLMPAQDRPALEDEEEFYVQELVGMQVIMQETGQAVGTVVDLYDGTGTYDTLRVQLTTDSGSGEGASTSSRTVLLPFVAEMVPIVDRQARRMEIAPPAGLLDIVTTQETKKKNVRRRPAPRKTKSAGAVSE
ncbi:16S rRNA processing protein RimM [Coccomyxa subellipsoidea C-169]|uniref:16S rRNA processing protein RimM n=1 Tax=Coccomyxa subellipsoidea (strain C-169) TaxID=574566 RepID=I0YT80_COCSC|nr:16S rRNA processing protein RimM [Coccomyxa subellipsoidea C-169]EIE21599.1 16S rRNA processing protein RimM [Coccomyxa subellipsoidea C-169]|eukprot:XP_005646143.1 16S rRNA processing protein RimM [Coccomyxa subellipsoidea C-169]